MCDRKSLETICIMCPVGCSLNIEKKGDDITVSGNACVRGEIYGKQEIIEPKRVVTSSVWCDGKRVFVRTSNPVPKDKIGEIKSVINSKIPELLSIPITTNNPIKVGKILKVISIPSVAPFKNTSKTDTFSHNALQVIIKITNGIAIIEI